MTAEDILMDLLIQLRKWENTESSIDADRLAAMTVHDASKKLKELL